MPPRTAWLVLGTRQFFGPSGLVNSRAHAILFTTEEKARAYSARLTSHNASWQLGVAEVPVNEDAEKAPLPESTKEN